LGLVDLQFCQKQPCMQISAHCYLLASC
jgi:hypothetical protein